MMRRRLSGLASFTIVAIILLMRMLCTEEKMDEKNLRIGDKMIYTRVKAEGLREKLATILSQEYKELAIQDLKVIGTGVQNIVFQGDSEKGL